MINYIENIERKFGIPTSLYKKFLGQQLAGCKS